jgi:hypothetical protein
MKMKQMASTHVDVRFLEECNHLIVALPFTLRFWQKVLLLREKFIDR